MSERAFDTTLTFKGCLRENGDIEVSHEEEIFIGTQTKAEAASTQVIYSEGIQAIREKLMACGILEGLADAEADDVPTDAVTTTMLSEAAKVRGLK